MRLAGDALDHFVGLVGKLLRRVVHLLAMVVELTVGLVQGTADAS